VVSTTGVAGLTLHGGFGHLRRPHGPSLDNLLSVDIVTADGELRVASADENPDLFWAVRGADPFRRDRIREGREEARWGVTP
jgi:FAD/FMN-containing dehydrogenase